MKTIMNMVWVQLSETKPSGYLGGISGWFGALTGPLGSQMVDLGCQDTGWVGGNDQDILDAILWQDGLILANLSVDKGKCGYFS